MIVKATNQNYFKNTVYKFSAETVTLFGSEARRGNSIEGKPEERKIKQRE